MNKMSWKRVFLGGLLAGIVFIVLGFASYYVYLGDAWKSVMEELGYPLNESIGMYILRAKNGGMKLALSLPFSL